MTSTLSERATSRLEAGALNGELATVAKHAVIQAGTSAFRSYNAGVSPTRLVVISTLAGLAGTALAAALSDHRPALWVLVVACIAGVVVAALWSRSPSLAEALNLDLRRGVLVLGALAVVGLVARLVFIVGLEDPASAGSARAVRLPPSPPDRVAVVPGITPPAGPVTPPPAPLMPAPPAPTESAARSFVTLRHGEPVHFEGAEVTLAVTFVNDRLGQTATLQISSTVAAPIVEGMLGPGGQILFGSRSGDRVLTVVVWSPENKTIDATIDPPIR